MEHNRLKPIYKWPHNYIASYVIHLAIADDHFCLLPGCYLFLLGECITLWGMACMMSFININRNMYIYVCVYACITKSNQSSIMTVCKSTKLTLVWQESCMEDLPLNLSMWYLGYISYVTRVSGWCNIPNKARFNSTKIKEL